MPPLPGPDEDPFLQQFESDDLPVLQDPALMRRAYDALGLDGSMKYTDENGVWDLTVAPPGTPECRDYSERETPIPHDSCRLPAFVRWLLVEPEGGEVSNWTKFTGLQERDLTVVVQDPPDEAPPAGPDSVQNNTDQNDSIQDDTVQDDSGPGVPEDDGAVPEQADLGPAGSGGS
ncbi:hypothetical protein [Spongiactinospora sp. TRM90649]|uniref:hypothetical protein n=1 Tax=Spongiactinospora sp. TRM90649 TaxID=3031114 RepID=UPI0023F9A52C|nr:hypothetical protein [Spongiactinospora sp. TRM90649]MDF5759320.1 hypothetical protein [Spongiactinospora sp. TRM90649]